MIPTGHYYVFVVGKRYLREDELLTSNLHAAYKVYSEHEALTEVMRLRKRLATTAYYKKHGLSILSIRAGFL